MVTVLVLLYRDDLKIGVPIGESLSGSKCEVVASNGCDNDNVAVTIVSFNDGEKERNDGVGR